MNKHEKTMSNNIAQGLFKKGEEKKGSTLTSLLSAEILSLIIPHLLSS